MGAAILHLGVKSNIGVVQSVTLSKVKEAALVGALQGKLEMLIKLGITKMVKLDAERIMKQSLSGGASVILKSQVNQDIMDVVSKIHNAVIMVNTKLVRNVGQSVKAIAIIKVLLKIKKLKKTIV